MFSIHIKNKRHASTKFIIYLPHPLHMQICSSALHEVHNQVDNEIIALEKSSERQRKSFLSVNSIEQGKPIKLTKKVQSIISAKQKIAVHGSIG